MGGVCLGSGYTTGPQQEECFPGVSVFLDSNQMHRQFLSIAEDQAISTYAFYQRRNISDVKAQMKALCDNGPVKVVAPPPMTVQLNSMYTAEMQSIRTEMEEIRQKKLEELRALRKKRDEQDQRELDELKE